MDNSASLINRIFQRKLVFLILFNALMVALGSGIAHYLGLLVNWTAYAVGQGITITVLLGMFFLNDYFEMLSPTAEYKLLQTTADLAALRKLQASILLASLSFLAIAGILTAFLVRDGLLNGAAVVLLSISFIASLAYAVPPFRLIYSGVGELIISLLLVVMIPAFSFSLQSSELHRYIAMTTIPLAFLFLSMLIVFQFSTYASDCKHCQNTLLVRIGWQKGWHLNNIFLIMGYIMLLLTRFQGLPWTIVWPSLLPMPIAVYLIILMNQVAAGKKPRWGIIKLTSAALVVLTAYLITFTYWTR